MNMDRLGVAKDLPELKVVDELGGLRNLLLVTKLATEENALETFLTQISLLYSPELGQEKISSESLEQVLMTLVFLTAKEAKEARDTVATGEDKLVVTKTDLEDYLLNKKPNYVKVLRCW